MTNGVDLYVLAVDAPLAHRLGKESREISLESVGVDVVEDHVDYLFESLL